MAGAGAPLALPRGQGAADAASARRAAQPAARPAAQSAAQSTARSFEAVFLGQMTKIMLESVETGAGGGDFGGGHGEEMFRGLAAEEMGRAIAARGGIGLAAPVLEQIIRLQDAGAPGARTAPATPSAAPSATPSATPSAGAGPAARPTGAADAR